MSEKEREKKALGKDKRGFLTSVELNCIQSALTRTSVLMNEALSLFKGLAQSQLTSQINIKRKY